MVHYEIYCTMAIIRVIDLPDTSQNKNARGVIGAMKLIIKNKEVDLNTKILLYTTAPLQALLWGAESWSLSKRILNTCNISHDSARQWTLGIKMNEVREKRIKIIVIRKNSETSKLTTI